MSLQITLTGQLTAEADGTRADATDLPGRQAPVVFAYLVAERDRPVPTEELAEAVWGGILPATWRPALRGVVSKVRDFLDRLGVPAADALTSSSGCYRLVLPSDTAVDVELAEGEAAAAGRALAAGRLEEAREAAERARAIAGRTLLPGHDGAWVEDRRAALHQLLVRSLELLVDVHLAAGEAGRAVGPAGELVALEPFRDSAYRRLLRAHTAAGDRAEALLAYDRYRRVLSEELGVGPSPELEALHLDLLQAETAPDAPAAEDGPPGAAPAAFAGRGPELRRLRAAWESARAGRHRTVLVAGEAGIGRTRLLAELAAHAEADGGVVLTGRCDPHLGVPCLALREAVGRHLAFYPPERLAAQLGPEVTELARFWPELAWRLPAVPPRTATDRETGAWQLFLALLGLLEAIASAGPLLLLVDDLHGADQDSLRLLASLAQARRPARLLMVLACRDDERPPRAGLTAALGELVRTPGAELLTLAGLQAGEVADLAAGAAAGPLGPGGDALAHVVTERTAGNPFLAGELLRHLAGRGLLAGGDVTGVAAGPAVDDVPEGVRWAVAQRLARLGGPVEHVLEAAAVLGRQVDAALLGRVAEVGHEQLLAALDGAVAAGLLEERPGLRGGYRFHHPIVRDLLYQRLPAGERARAHRRVGQALEELTGGADRLGELADHFALGGEPSAEQAAGYARRAAEEAAAAGRHEEAAQRLGQALAVLDRAGGHPDPARRSDLLLEAGDAWAAAGQVHRATDAYLRGAAAARSAGEAGRLAEAALRLGGPAGSWSAEPSRAVPTGLLDEALRAVGPGDGRERALLLARLAAWETAGARLAAGPAHALAGFGEAVAMARRLGDPRTLASVLADREVAWIGVPRPGGPGAALEATAELDRLATGLGDAELAYQACRARSGALLAVGDLAGLERLAGRVARLGGGEQVPHHQWLALRLRAATAMARGDFAAAERLADQALAAGGRNLGAAAAMTHGLLLVLLRWLQGRPDEVASLLERLAAEHPLSRHAWTGLLPLAWAGQARDAEARQALEVALAEGAGDPPGAGRLVALVGACAQLGDAAAADRLGRLLAPLAGHHLAAPYAYLGPADLQLGIVHAVAGRWPASLDHFRVAMATSRRLGARPWQALTTRAYAAMLRGRGRPGDQRRAAALDAAAEAVATLLGMRLPGAQGVRWGGAGASSTGRGDGSTETMMRAWRS